MVGGDISIRAPAGFMGGQPSDLMRSKSTEYLVSDVIKKPYFFWNTFNDMDTFLPPAPTARSTELQYVGPEETSLLIKEIVRRHQVFMQDFWVWFNELNAWRESLELRLERIEKRLPAQEFKRLEG